MRLKNALAWCNTKWTWCKNKWDWCKTWCKAKLKQIFDWLMRFLDWLIRHLDQLIAIFIIALILVVLIPESWYLFKLIEYLLGISNKKEALTFIGLGIGGLVLWKRATSAEKHAGAIVKTNEITEISRVQERLKISIEHLGNEEKSVRIGAAYELYHLAADYKYYKKIAPDHKDYRETVCDILCSHIRQKTQEEDYPMKYTNKPSEEVQTFLNLLCGKEKGDIFNPCQRDLASSFLRGANLWMAHLQSANLQGSQLQGANLQGAQMQRASLREAQLQGTHLRRAQIQGADLWRAQIQGANLLGAQLQGAILADAQLQGAHLWQAQLQGAILAEAQMRGAILAEAQMQGADLSQAQMQGADLSQAQMQGAYLLYAQMQGADLSQAQMQGADLLRAQMQGADLLRAQIQGAILGEAQLQGVSSSGLHPCLTFQEWIRSRIGQDHDFRHVIFSGGLSVDQVEKIIVSMPSGVGSAKKEKLKSGLNEHIGQTPSNKLPENSGAITGKYSAEDAEQWIKEYNKAMESVPKKQPESDS